MKKLILSILIVLLFCISCSENNYTITFIGYDGEIIEIVEVEENNTIIPPKVNVPEGKRFTGWDKSFDTITSDMTINAMFEDIPTLNIQQTNISSNSITLNFSNIISDIKLYASDNFIRDIEYNTNLIIDDLSSNKDYTIKYIFDGQSYEYSFKTLPLEPNFSIDVLSVTSDSISINIKEEDIDNIAEIANVQLYLGDILVKESKECEIIFDELDDNTEYLIILNYYNNFKDENITLEKKITTEEEVIIYNPEIDIINIETTYNSITFDVMENIDGNYDYITNNELYDAISFSIKEFTLYNGEEIIKNITDINSKVKIYDLNEKTNYKIVLSYSYISNNETIEKTITKDIQTPDYFSYVFEYQINFDHNIVITGLKNDTINLIIPDEYEIDGIKYKVTEIGDEAFRNKFVIETVKFGKNISRIGHSAFVNCINLKDISFERTNDDIITVMFSGAVFRLCRSLKSIDLTNIRPYSISGEMFMDCDYLEFVKLSGYEEFIDIRAFSGCTRLVSVENGLGVKGIICFAFENCEKLENLEFPKLEIIDRQAFENCINLKTFNFDKVKEIYGKAFYNCSSLTTIYLPTNVVKIISGAFSNCPSLIINTGHKSKPELWYDDFKDESTIINYNVLNK